MSKRVLMLTLLVVALVLAVTACQGTTTNPTTQAPTTSGTAKKLKVGVVTDVGGPDDKSFNQTSIAGLNKAIQDGLIDPSSKYLQSRQQTDYSKNIEEFISQGYDMVVTIGFLLGVDTATEAKKNPNVKFAIVDYTYPDCAPGAKEGTDCGSSTAISNVLGLHFNIQEATFQAGYLAAALSKTKKVGTFGGINIPPVVDFSVGFEGGIHYYNKQHNDNVQLIGWNTAKNDGVFTNTFTDPAKGKQSALSLIDEGADIILPVAGSTGNGAFTAAQERKVYAIGVDTDQCVSIPDACPVLITSNMKRTDTAVYNAIKAAVDGSFKGGVYTATLANGGVGLAPYHNNASMVSDALQKELDQIKADIIAGKIDITALAKGQ